MNRIAVSLFVIIGLIILIALVAIVLFYYFSKKKINKKLSEDKETIKTLGRPVKTRNHSSVSVGGVIAVIAIIGVLAILLASLGELKISLNQSVENLNEKIIELDQSIKEAQNTALKNQKLQNSMISSFKVVREKNCFDSQNVTAKLYVDIVLKSTSTDTVVNLKIDNKDYNTERIGNTFRAVFERDIFSTPDSYEILLTATTNGVSVSEIVDEDLFEDVYELLNPDYKKYLPYCDDSFIETGITHNNKSIVIELKTDRLLIFKPEYSDVTLKKIFIEAYVDDKLVKTYDLSDKIKDLDSSSWCIDDVNIEFTTAATEDDSQALVLCTTDSLGYTIKNFMFGFGDKYIDALDYEVEGVYSPEGYQICSERY